MMEKYNSQTMTNVTTNSESASQIRAIFVRVILATILLSLVSGIQINYPSLKPILISEGVYSQACQDNETDIIDQNLCIHQDLDLNRLSEVRKTIKFDFFAILMKNGMRNSFN